jgi:hypothetical protein
MAGLGWTYRVKRRRALTWLDYGRRCHTRVPPCRRLLSLAPRGGGGGNLHQAGLGRTSQDRFKHFFRKLLNSS